MCSCSALWPHGPKSTRLHCLWNFPGKNTGVGFHFLLQGIFPTQDQTHDSCVGRQVLYHWAPREAPVSTMCVLSRSVVSNSLWPQGCSPAGSVDHGDSPSKNTGGYHALLQGIFPPPQGSNPGLPHCRWILYHLSHWGSSQILERVAYPFFGGFSQPENQTRVSHSVGKVFTSWATRETP